VSVDVTHCLSVHRVVPDRWSGTFSVPGCDALAVGHMNVLPLVVACKRLIDGLRLVLLNFLFLCFLGSTLLYFIVLLEPQHLLNKLNIHINNIHNIKVQATTSIKESTKYRQEENE